MFSPTADEKKNLEVINSHKATASVRAVLKRELGKQARILMNINDVNVMLTVQGACQAIRDMYKLFDINPEEDIEQFLVVNEEKVVIKQFSFWQKLKYLFKKVGYPLWTR